MHCYFFLLCLERVACIIIAHFKFFLMNEKLKFKLHFYIVGEVIEACFQIYKICEHHNGTLHFRNEEHFWVGKYFHRDYRS